MKTFFLLFLMLASLYGTSERKIIIGSFPSQQTADRALEKFESQLDSEFYVIQDQYGFNIVARPSGRTFIVALEPFDSYQTAKEVKEFLPPAYADAFINKYTPPPSQAVKREQFSDKTAVAPPVTTEPNATRAQKPVAALLQTAQTQEHAAPPSNSAPLTPSTSAETAKPPTVISEAPTTTAPSAAANTTTVTVASDATEEPSAPIEPAPAKTTPDASSATVYNALTVAALLAAVALLLALIKFYRDNRLLKEKLHASDTLYNGCCDEKNHLEETLTSKDAFLENLTLSLKKPIDSILNSTQALTEISTNRKEHELLENITASSSKLDEVINNIIDITNLRSNALDLERVEFNINTILETVAASANQMALEKGVEITFDIDTKMPIKYMGDPLRINQILTNILNQSLNNTQRGEIIISLKPREVTDSTIDLEVTFRDTGIGFRQEEIDSVFNDFADEHVFNIDSNIKIGLIMSKQLINTMGGDIKLKSSYGHGSSFVFNLVLDLPEQVEQRKYRLPYKEIMKYSALIVDNNVLAARVLRQQLEYFHLKVKPSFSWEHAAKIIHDEFHHIDFLILNSNVLGETSIEELSDIAEKQGLQIVFVVHDMRDIHYQIMEKFQHAHFLHKPFTQKKLLDLLITIHEINLEKESYEG
ncbi:MAG: hypothetical protein DSZ03_03310 [Sulfurimonas sp.]|nr:MAG: hypothetical protein DSZ03_03310 [Sulfurimonas sp.]